MNKIRYYIEKLFAGAPNTEEANNLKDEITQNVIEKYKNNIKNGKTESEAYYEAISTVGDINELIDELNDESIDENIAPKHLSDDDSDNDNCCDDNDSNEEYYNSISYDKTNNSYKINPAFVNSLSAKMLSGTFNVYTYDGNSVIITENIAEGSDFKPLKVELKNGKLIIDVQQTEHGSYGVYTLKDLKNYKKKLSDRQITIKIPTGKVFDKFRVSSVSARVFIGGIYSDYTSIENVSAKIELVDLVSRKLEIEQVSGKTMTENLLCNEGNIESVSGKIELNMNKIQGFEINFEAVSGKLTHDIKGDYKYNMSKNFCHHQYNLKYKDGRNKINIDSVSGSTKIS